mgnify:CR=1 FL=1|jgi:cell wall-associated NlpC family hydrolase
MIPTETISKALLDIDNWLPNYLGLPYKHLGNTREGIDCFNLPVLIYKEVLNEIIPYNTQDSGCDVSVDWYGKVETSNILAERASPRYGWEVVTKLRPFDLILLSIGATNAPNHCAMYISNNKILQVMQGYPSWVTKYGVYYKQYTIKAARWNRNLLNY